MPRITAIIETETPLDEVREDLQDLVGEMDYPVRLVEVRGTVYFTHALVTGSLASGFSIRGVFTSEDAAQAEAEAHLDTDDYTILPIDFL